MPKVSDDELLAAALCKWICLALLPRSINLTDREWHFRAWTPKFRSELTALEIWMMLDVSGRLALVDNKERLHGIWDRVFADIHNRFPESRRQDLRAWNLGTPYPIQN